MIRLFTTAFPVKDSSRREEYALALRRNLECRAIDEVCVLAEPGALVGKSPKLRLRSVSSRPEYADYFAWINEVASADDISIVSNADIYFDETIAAVAKALPDARAVFALARWDGNPSGGFEVRNRNDSQDSWVFRGKVRAVRADFPIGVPRCDNRIAAELDQAGYRVANPAFSIRSFHLHAGERGGYPTGQQAGFVEPPYLYVWPHNALSPSATLLHNLRNPQHRLSWRVDSRIWNQRLRIHWLRKLVPALAGKGPKT